MRRTVEHLITAERHVEGGGFVVRRPFPIAKVDHIDPFLLIDEMGPIESAPGQAVGAPDHPHRGFETVTYFLEGEGQHEDSAGHRGTLRAGDVQWMTAGAGVIHSEEPSARILAEGGRVHGFQIWVNLPARDKRMAPRYQEVASASIPVGTAPHARVKVIAGEALGVKAAIETRTPILYQDWTLEPGADLETRAPAGWNVMAYMFEGSAAIAGRLVREGQLAVLGEGDTIHFATSTPARFLLLGGEPINEPVARYGPFVMNTDAEIRQAIRDFQSGQFGQIAR